MRKPKTFDFSARLFELDDDFKVFTGSAVKPAESDIAAFEEEFGFGLEEGYRAFVASVGCAAAVVEDEVWPPPVAFEIRPAWKTQRGLELFGFVSTKTPPPLDVRLRTERLRERGLEGWVATLGVIGADLVLAHDAAGNYAWIDGDGDVEPVSATFEHLLDVRLTQLQADKDRFVAERAAQEKARAAATRSAEDIADALVESPWDVDELLEHADEALREEVRAIVLAKLAAAPDAELVAAAATLPGASATVGIIAALHGSPGADVREAVAEALAECEGDEVWATLERLLDDETPSVVRAAVESLAEVAARDGRDGLADEIFARLERWVSQGDDLTLSTIVEILGKQAAADPRTVAAIAPLWDISVRRGGTLMASNAVFDALAAIAPNDPRTVATFENALVSDSAYLRARGIKGLAATRDMSAHLPTLVALLGDDSDAVQAHAEAAFVALGEAARATLKDLEKTTRGRVKAGAKRALEALSRA